MRFSVQGDYVFDRVLVSKEKALSAENFVGRDRRPRRSEDKTQCYIKPSLERERGPLAVDE